MTLALRILPPAMTIRRPQRMLERHLVAYKREWMVIASGFFEPLFYLLSMRVGVGSLIGTVEINGRQVAYEHFVAPGLMAASAMNGAIFDSTMNVFHRLKHGRVYEAALATPMSPADVAVGEIGWALLRGQLYAVSFLVVMAALGLTTTWWSLLAVPACAFIGLAFAALGFAITTFMRTWSDLDVLQTLLMPMFLFSATFFPVSAYGEWRWAVQLSPLYHGVAMIQAATNGVWSPAILVHLAVLVGLAALGIAVASRRIDRLLRR